MKQIGKCIVGDPVRLDNYTSTWNTVKVHPGIFYRKMKEFEDGLELTKDLYAEIDMGQYVLIRFREKEDLTAFHRRHNAYL
jgi:hypothetical protein